MQRAQELSQRVKGYDAQVRTLVARAGAYKAAFETRLGPQARRVIGGIAATASSIEYLRDLEEAAGRAQLGRDDPDRRSNLRAQTGIAKTSADEVELALQKLLLQYNEVRDEGAKVCTRVKWGACACADGLVAVGRGRRCLRPPGGQHE